jgi:hypothetical protein
MSDWIRAIGRMLRRDGTQPTGSVLADRFYSYMAWDAYYHNQIYNSLAQGGQRENLNAILGNAAAADLAGLYNPIAEVCDLYQHVLGGTFGVDITVQSDNDKLLPALRMPGQPAPPATPLELIWQWSSIQQAKQILCSLAPRHGNVGLRIVARRAVEVNGKQVELPLEQRRVFIKPEHPRIIRDVERDERGNVIAIELEYDEATGLGDDREVERIREQMTKTEFRLWTVKQGTLEPRAQYANELGVVPYVLLDHQPSGETWGLNAFYRAAPLIDRLNALATHVNIMIHRHVRATWLVAAAGGSPEQMDFSGGNILYVNTQTTGGSVPLVEPLVAPLNLADAIEQTKALQEQVEDRLPELKATAGKFLANQSGETVAQLRKPAEDRLALARVNYEDALVRAQQIALSFGVLYELWDVGTGMGTREAAERAYRNGYEDHVFNDRELLPLTETERLVIAESKSRIGLSRKRTLKSIGLSEEDASANEVEVGMQQATAMDAAGRLFDQGAAV